MHFLRPNAIVHLIDTVQCKHNFICTEKAKTFLYSFIVVVCSGTLNETQVGLHRGGKTVLPLPVFVSLTGALDIRLTKDRVTGETQKSINLCILRTYGNTQG